MTQFANKTFSVSCSSGDVPEDELAKRWAETFGRKTDKAEDVSVVTFKATTTMHAVPVKDETGSVVGALVQVDPLVYEDASRALNAGTDADADLYGFGCEGVDMMPIEDDDE